MHVGAHVYAGGRLRFGSAQFSGERGKLFTQVGDDSFLVANGLGIRDFLLPFDILLFEQLVFPLQSSESALKADESFSFSMDISQIMGILLDPDALDINSEGTSDFIEATEQSSHFTTGRGVAARLQTLGDDA